MTVGLIGCGGRGTGAALQAMNAEDGTVVLTAVADPEVDLVAYEKRKIKGAIHNLTDAAMKLGEAIYKAGQEEAEAGGAEDDGPRGVDDDIVDADFEEVK